MKKIISCIVLSLLMLGNAGAMIEESNIDEYELNIVDVTNGAELRGIATSADAAGYATASYEDGEYMLMAEFQNLTDPLGDDFYEGWVVRKDPFAFWSTGKLEKQWDIYVNEILSSVDYSDYDFYVLTLEPNDDDPAPADHIVEGDVMMAQMMEDTMMKHDEEMMTDSMTDKPDMMKSKMMEKEMTPRQKNLRVAIKKQLEKVDSSKFYIEAITERIDTFKATIDSRNYSAMKKTRTIELLDALLEVLTEMKMMSEDSMMMDK